MDEFDRRLLNRLQHGLPLEPHPYALLAAELDCREEDILRRLDDLLDDGTLQRGAPDLAGTAHPVRAMIGRALAADDRDGIRSEQLPEWQVEYDTGTGLGQGSTLYLTTDEYALLAPRSSGVRAGWSVGRHRSRRRHAAD